MTLPAQSEFIEVRHFVHPGPPSYPRILDCEMQGTVELRITIPSRANLGPTLQALLESRNFRSGVARFCEGTLTEARYHVVVKTTNADRPYSYGPPIVVPGPVKLVTGVMTYGRTRDDRPILHCHAGFVDSTGTSHGGHLVLDPCIVGDEPVVVRICVFAEGEYAVREDRETNFNLLKPIPLERE